ncbi:MAG: hypothetical protein AB7T49_06530 [Oligoflexales bacterium]
MKNMLKKYRTALQIMTILALVSLLSVIVASMTQVEQASRIAYLGTPYVFICLIVTLLVLVSAGFHAAISYYGENEGLSKYCFMVCLFSGMLFGIEVIDSISPINPTTRFALTLIPNLTLSYYSSMVAWESSGPKKGTFIVWIAPTLIISWAVVSLLYQDLIDVKDSLTVVGFLRSFSLSFVLMFFHAILRVNRNKSDKAFEKPESQAPTHWMFLTITGLNAATLIVFFIGHAISHSNAFSLITQVPLSNFDVAWLPITAYGIMQLAALQEHKTVSEMLSRLPSEHARRFLIRHKQETSTWAASTGMRTSSFILDHDPYDQTSSQLTATIGHIRREEINRAIQTILGNKLLSCNSLGNQIHGTLDPENSIRTTVDLLSLFCAIYLDAAHLIERKLKRLASLFPIIDENLGKLVSPKEIEASQSKLEWLFYFDFVWIDEHVIGKDDRISYEVSTADLKFSTRNDILAQLQKENRTGNFIWIGEKARERLQLEAPFLANVIEEWDVSLRNHNLTIYLIKFEELIPRIQKYYNLDEIRTSLKDYEPTVDGRNFLRFIEAKIEEIQNIEDVNEVLGSLSAYSYYGFKERDAALQTVLTVFQHVQKITSNFSIAPENAAFLKRRFNETVMQIGYPGQLMHVANTSKRAIRDVERLFEVCLDTHNPRFNEAWLFLATTDASRYSHEDLRRLLALVQTAIADENARKQKIVTKKIVEAFFNVSQYLSAMDQDIIKNLLDGIGLFLVEKQVDAETCCLFLDGKIFLEKKFEMSFPLHPQLLHSLGQYFGQLYHRLGPKSATIASISTRWKQVS